MNIPVGEALETRKTPYGSVGVVHAGPDLEVWWIRKDDEEIDQHWSRMPREDLLYVIEGTLRLELEHDDPRDLAAGGNDETVAGRSFRGYRWPRDGQPCLFLAVSVKDQQSR